MKAVRFFRRSCYSPGTSFRGCERNDFWRFGFFTELQDLIQPSNVVLERYKLTFSERHEELDVKDKYENRQDALDRHGNYEDLNLGRKSADQRERKFGKKHN